MTQKKPCLSFTPKWLHCFQLDCESLWKFETTKEIKTPLKHLLCRTKSISLLNLSTKKISKVKDNHLELLHLIYALFFFFSKPCSSLPPPALMVIGIDKWWKMVWYLLRTIVPPAQSHRGKEPQIFTASDSPIPHMSVRLTVWEDGVPRKKIKIKTQLYCLSNINFVSH